MDRKLTTMKDEAQHPCFNRYCTLSGKTVKEPDNSIIRTGSVFDKKKGEGDAAFPCEHPCPLKYGQHCAASTVCYIPICEP